MAGLAACELCALVFDPSGIGHSLLGLLLDRLFISSTHHTGQCVGV